ncbi:hypothetical protein JI750_04240 [Flavobacterium sp. GN10]|uniref:Lipoprotein n=3 Tax=Flavobacterium TaxID=237 RepID=A0A521CR49_9FLAO|nr:MULTISPECIES: hypothetical protein [Flavobacterium]KAF2328439.1 hypothetical protein DM397_17880 [Flavobacterium nitrogenifigens]MBL0736082.1 hypothetical protein [Flavobacterium tagetis]MDQ8011805.1 hypothetical protein [Flavobacterium nitrogenifigens]SMO61140.1 hypothetical protein SAMN06265220_102494 [Flavobacterium nitrogenifigens]
MRIVSLLLLTLFIATGCCSQKKADMKSTQIEYSAMSRGYYKSIVVQNKSVSVVKERNAEAVKSNIDDAKWNKIVDAYSKVNLESLSTLKAPTDKRTYDGAAIGNLKITKDGKTYETPGFDNGFPPKEIEKLVNLLVDFSKE